METPGCKQMTAQFNGIAWASYSQAGQELLVRLHEANTKESEGNPWNTHESAQYVLFGPKGIVTYLNSKHLSSREGTQKAPDN